MNKVDIIIIALSLLLSAGCTNAQNKMQTIHNDINWQKRSKVFYIICNQEDDKGYHISKTQRTFIIDDKVLIREFRNSDSRIYDIKEIHYQGDSIITAIVDNDIMAPVLYSDILAGHRNLDWEQYTDYNKSGKATRKVTLTKDKSTLIWSVEEEGFTDSSQWIDSYDILPSRYYYQNQRTMPHNPDNESFLPPERPVFSGEYKLDEAPIVIAHGTEGYNAMERPYEGTWLQITKTDIGDVVYNYPLRYNGHGYERQTIKVENEILTVTDHAMQGSTESSKSDPVLFYPNDGSYRFYPWAELCYEFKWIDQKKHICQWTIFRIDYNTHKANIWAQKKYINEAHTNLPVIIYDWQ